MLLQRESRVSALLAAPILSLWTESQASQGMGPSWCRAASLVQERSSLPESVRKEESVTELKINASRKGTTVPFGSLNRYDYWQVGDRPCSVVTLMLLPLGSRMKSPFV